MSAIEQGQDGPAASGAQRPLVVDLDGSLLRTDLLHECFWRLASARPLHAARLALAHLGDRAKLKIALAEAADLDVETLPVNDPVAARLADAQAAVCPLLIYWLGRMLLLADRGEIDDDPIVFALKDKVSLGLGAAMTLSFLAASTL